MAQAAHHGSALSGAKPVATLGAMKQDDLSLHVKAVLQIKQGHYAAAQQTLQKGLTSNPQNHLFYMDVAELHSVQGRRNEAIAALIRAAELMENDPEKRRLLWFQISALKIEDGKFGAAAELLAKVVEQEPNLTKARVMLANAYQKVLKHEKAIPHLQQIVAANAANIQACIDLAFCFHQIGDASKSYAFYQQALKQDPRSLKALLGQAHLLHEAKQHALSLQTYQQVQQVDPMCQVAHTSTVAILVETGKVAEAVKYYSEIISDRTVVIDAASHVAIAQSLKDAGDLDVALAAAKRALQSNYKCSGALLVWGDVLHRKKQHSEAIEKYMQGVTFAPTSSDLHSALGHAYKDIGELDKCVAAYKQAVDCDPTNPTLVFNLGQGLEYINAYEEAITTLSTYLAPLTSVSMTTVNHHAIYILIIKLLFVHGQFEQLASLVAAVLDFPQLVIGALQQLKTHWAYFYFLSNLLSIQFPPTERHKPLYLVAAWRTVQLRDKEQCTLVPKLITGLKAYHLKSNYRFLTVSNLHILLASIPRSEKEIIFVCGEIDTREGIPKAMEKKLYKSIEHATRETVRIYREGVDVLSAQYKFHFWVHPVTPPINLKNIDRAQIVATWNKELALQFGRRYLHFDDQLRDGPSLFLRASLNCDGTHLSPLYASLLDAQLRILPPLVAYP